MMAKAYQEEEGSTFTFGTDFIPSAEYDLNALFKLVHVRKVVNVSVKRLKWILEYDTPDPDRVEAADVTTPLLVVKHLGVYYAVDGLHRLTKAVSEELETMPCKIISLAEMKTAKVKE